ncbi:MULTISPECIES: GNAT family N-acetyltransferase [Methanoculleus]|uniref:GCN5-related N-acetyltransferase n=2 Tax=Methanoculleus TaxID=45989 RepID=A3CXV3_METMJ|nr:MULTISPECIES: GNAT family protein [Methanoculleus]ABN58203.1 GCN5-related N-acetyltransferase [Methanoculleus marisnigri JR1]MCC7554902.1 GNAT family N-acetyltransferase [Methanoculleus marisnigri]UYU19583.1 GNAT family N-acetyltransferase [Methanoculleus submarinus]
MQIVTPGSVLRTWTPDDAGALARHANNPRIAATMRDRFPYPYTPADARRFIETAMDTTSHLYLAIEVCGEAVGGIGVQPLDDVKHRTAEIGYWLSEPFWGRGIVTDAVRSLVPVAFERFDIVRLEAGVFSNNPASMHVLEKCGFTREAVHRMAITKNGAAFDEVVYVRFAGKDAGR